MQWLIFITEGNVTLAYLSFKILTSMYLMVSYILSHVVYAFSYSNKNPVNKLVIEEREDLENDVETVTITCFGYGVPDYNRTSDWPYYWIYFTNWSWTLLVVSFCFDTSLVMLRFREQKQCIHRKLENNGVIAKPTYKGNIFLGVLMIIYSYNSHFYFW